MKFKKVLKESFYRRCPKCTNHTLAKVEGTDYEDLFICDECGAELRGHEQFDGSFTFTDWMEEDLGSNNVVSTWTQAYDLFQEIINKYFPNEGKIEVEVRNLYNQHKGEEPFEIAYQKWCDSPELNECQLTEKYDFNQLYQELANQDNSIREGLLGILLFDTTFAHELYREFYKPLTDLIRAGDKESALKEWEQLCKDLQELEGKRYAKEFVRVQKELLTKYKTQIDNIAIEANQPVAVNEDYLDTPEYAIQRYEDDIPELFHHIHDGYMSGMVNAKAYAEALRTIYSALEELNYLNEGKEEIKVDDSNKQILTEKSWKYRINKEVAFKLRDALEADVTDYDELKAAMSAVYDEIHRLVPDYFDEDECQEKKFDLDMLPTEDDEDADFDDPEYMDEDEIESEWNYALEDIWDMCDAFNIWLPIRGLDEDIEGGRNKRPHVGTLFDIVSDVRVNGPKYRGGRMPQPNPFAINVTEFPDNMRPKHFYADIVDDNIQFTYYTQEPFTPEDTKDFIAEVTRFFKGIAEFEDYGKPFKVLLNVRARDGKEYGNLVYDIDIVPELEEGLKENMDSLPSTVTVEFTNSEVVDEDYISEYLCNKYEYCPKGFTFEVEGNKVVISDIEWDLNESKNKDSQSALTESDSSTTQVLLDNAKQLILNNKESIEDVISAYQDTCDEYNDEYDDYDTYDDSDMLWEFHSQLIDILLKLGISKPIIEAIKEYGNVFGISSNFNYEQLVDDINSLNTEDLEEFINESFTKEGAKVEEPALVEAVQEPPVEFTYRVYEMSAGLALDCIHSFTDKDKAIAYAKKQPFPTQVVFATFPTMDHGPEYADYIKENAPYEEFEVVWKSDSSDELEEQTINPSKDYTQVNFEPEYDYDDDQYDFDDDVEQDRMHAALYGGDRTYCDKCGTKLIRDEWGGSCPNCDAEQIERDRQNSLIDDDLNYSINEDTNKSSDIDLEGILLEVSTLLENSSDTDWIEIFWQHEARVGLNDQVLPFTVHGETKTLKGTIKPKQNRLEINFINGSEAICDNELEIARFIAGEFGVPFNN